MKSIPDLNIEATEDIRIVKIEKSILIEKIKKNIQIEEAAGYIQIEKIKEDMEIEATEDFQTTSIQETTEAIDRINILNYL